MALINILSDNHNFSFELSKNPGTGLQVQDTRKGHCFGWYSRTSQQYQYNLYFQDNPFTCSFNQSFQDEVEYNDLERYVNPDCYLLMLNKMISIKDNGGTGNREWKYSINLNSVKLSNLKLVSMMQKDLTGRFDIELKSISKDLDNQKIHGVSFACEATQLYELLQVVKLFLVLQTADQFAIDDKIDVGQVDKYVKIINKLDLDYQIRNLFKTRCLTPTLFKKYKDILEESKHQKFELSFGTNFELRKEFILNSIDYKSKSNVVDFGSGRGKYLRPICKRFSENPKFKYIAIEQHPETFEDLTHTIRKEQLKDTAVARRSWEEFQQLDSSDTQSYVVLCTEVLEHNTIEDIDKILSKFKEIRYNQLILTTPNKDFNLNYNLDDSETRDSDHVQEFTKPEVQALLEKHFSAEQIAIRDIGDKVNGVSSTIGVIISKSK